MSDFLLPLVLQIKTRKALIWHGKDSNKIRETHSFWRNIFNYGAIWLQTLICNRLDCHARTIAKELLVCRFCIILLCLYELWSKSTSYISPTFNCPVANRQFRSNVFSLSAVLKSWVLPVSDVYDMFSWVSSFMVLKIVSALQVRSVGWSERWLIKWVVTSSIHEPPQK